MADILPPLQGLSHILISVSYTGLANAELNLDTLCLDMPPFQGFCMGHVSNTGTIGTFFGNLRPPLGEGRGGGSRGHREGALGDCYRTSLISTSASRDVPRRNSLLLSHSSPSTSFTML